MFRTQDPLSADQRRRYANRAQNETLGLKRFVEELKDGLRFV